MIRRGISSRRTDENVPVFCRRIWIHHEPSLSCVIFLSESRLKSTYASPVKVEKMNMSLTNCSCGFSTGVVISVLRSSSFMWRLFLLGSSGCRRQYGSRRNVPWLTARIVSFFSRYRCSCTVLGFSLRSELRNISKSS